MPIKKRDNTELKYPIVEIKFVFSSKDQIALHSKLQMMTIEKSA
jgi:hypothetical protein